MRAHAGPGFWAALFVTCSAPAANSQDAEPPDVARTREAIQALDAARVDADRARLAGELGALGDSLHAAGADSLASRAWQAVGWSLFRRGQVDSASAMWERGLDLARSLGAPALVASHLNSAGIGRTVGGDANAGIACWEEAIDICRTIGDRKLEGSFWGNLANAYARLGRIPDVRRATEHALAIDRETGNTAGVASGHGRLASVFHQMAEYAAAIAHADSAVALSRPANPSQLALSLTRRAQILFDSGRVEEALRDFAEADSIASATGELREARFLKASQATALHSLEQYEATIALVDSILDGFAEESPDRTVALRTLRGNAKAHLGRFDEAREDLETAYDLWNDTRDRLEDSTDRAAMFALAGEIYATLVEFHRMQGNPREAWRFAEEGRARELRGALGGEEPIALSELQAILGESDAVLLQYTEARSVAVDVVVVSRDAVHVASIGRIGPLLEDAEIALRLLASGASDEDCAVPLARLAAALLPEDVRPWLEGARRVYVVPPSYVLPLPFEALPLDDESTLADRAAVAYLPGATALAALGKRPVGGGRMVVFADPSVVEAAGSSGSWRSAARVPLPEARREADAVATRDADVWIGSEATAARLASCGAAPVIHFATHATIDESSSASTGLVLAGEDGLLGPDDIALVSLTADLVTLSGCSTASGFTFLGEGTFGVARAFLLAGTRSVVTSAWDVEDGAARRFMELFYDHLREGQPRADALRLAQLAMRSEGFPLRDRAAFLLTGIGHEPVASLAGASRRGPGLPPLRVAAALSVALIAVFFAFRRVGRSARTAKQRG